MTDMVIPPEAVRDAEKAWSRAYHAKPLTGDDHSWMRAALEAALPHLRPMLELAGNLGRELGRREALDDLGEAVAKVRQRLSDVGIFSLDEVQRLLDIPDDAPTESADPLERREIATKEVKP